MPELEALVRREPLRERPLELLMLALDRSGRQADDIERNVVLRIDPRTNTVVETIRLGARPTSVALGGGLVWVAVT